MLIKAGDVIRVDGRASVQFAGDRALLFRITVIDTKPTYTGWVWLTGYVLNERGEATARREIFIQYGHLRPIRAAHPGPSRSPKCNPRA